MLCREDRIHVQTQDTSDPSAKAKSFRAAAGFGLGPAEDFDVVLTAKIQGWGKLGRTTERGSAITCRMQQAGERRRVTWAREM